MTKGTMELQERTEHRTFTEPSVSTIDSDLIRAVKLCKYDETMICILAEDLVLAERICDLGERQGNGDRPEKPIRKLYVYYHALLTVPLG